MVRDADEDCCPLETPRRLDSYCIKDGDTIWAFWEGDEPGNDSEEEEGSEEEGGNEDEGSEEEEIDPSFDVVVELMSGKELSVKVANNDTVGFVKAQIDRLRALHPSIKGWCILIAG